MSKSDENVNASVYLMDSTDDIMRKFKRAVTDSMAQIVYSDEQPGVRNLLDKPSYIKMLDVYGTSN